MSALHQIPAEVIAKIKKCLALTSSNWAGESRNAMEAAQRLMEEYGLTQAQVEMTEDLSHVKPESFVESSTDDDRRWMYAWEKLLSLAIGHLLPVKCFLKGGSVVFIGTVSDSAMAVTFYKLLASEVRKLAKSEVGVTSQRSFMYGCSRTLVDRSKEIERQRERAQDTSASRALVLVKKTDVVEYVRQHYRFSSVSMSAPSGASDAMSRGRAAGHSISLNLHGAISNGSRGLLR